jgi:NitT/TauT family transport system substrate-binding protein
VHIGDRRVRPFLVATAVLTLFATLAGCSRADKGSGADTTKAANQGPAAELRLGYFPNVTHAAALIALDKGFLTKDLGQTKLTPQSFNAGPDEVSALLGGSLDAAFIGSGPAITAFSKSDGAAVRLVAGATSGGAQLVVKPDINSPADLKGKTVSDPQLANTQDVSLKTWLTKQNLTGQVTVANMANSQSLTEFGKGDIQGAWLPEPYSSQLVLDEGAKVLVDESTLWPNGQFPTTVLVVRTEYLQQHPDTVKALIQAEVDAVGYAQSDHAGAEAAVNDQLKQLTGKALPQPVLDRAFSKITLTFDPLAGDFPELAQDQVVAKVAPTAPKTQGLTDLTLLNQVLAGAGKPAVDPNGKG